MADEISPSLPLTPSPKVDVPPEDRRRERPGSNTKKENDADNKNTSDKPRPSQGGLIDEYA